MCSYFVIFDVVTKYLHLCHCGILFWEKEEKRVFSTWNFYLKIDYCLNTIEFNILVELQKCRFIIWLHADRRATCEYMLRRHNMNKWPFLAVHYRLLSYWVIISHFNNVTPAYHFHLVECTLKPHVDFCILYIVTFIIMPPPKGVICSNYYNW